MSSSTFYFVYILIMVTIAVVFLLIPMIRNHRYAVDIARRQRESTDISKLIEISQLSEEDIQNSEIEDILTEDCIQLHTELGSLKDIEAIAGFTLSEKMSDSQLDKLDGIIKEYSANPNIKNYGKLFEAGLYMNGAKLKKTPNKAL